MVKSRGFIQYIVFEKLIALFGKILSIEAKFTKKPQKEDCHILEVSKIEYFSFSAKFFAFWQNRSAYKVRQKKMTDGLEKPSVSVFYFMQITEL